LESLLRDLRMLLTATPCTSLPAAWAWRGIVVKRRDNRYRSGRSTAWVKIKNLDAPAASRIIEW